MPAEFWNYKDNYEHYQNQRPPRGEGFRSIFRQWIYTMKILDGINLKTRWFATKAHLSSYFFNWPIINLCCIKNCHWPSTQWIFYPRPRLVCGKHFKEFYGEKKFEWYLKYRGGFQIVVTNYRSPYQIYHLFDIRD